MSIFRVSKLNWQEPTAYGVALFSLIFGIYLAIYHHADWIGRAGSIIIVCGVLLAASRKYDILHAEATTLINAIRAREIKRMKETLTSPDGQAPTDQEVAEIVDKVIADAHQGVGEIIDDRKRVFKRHEIFLVVAGTVINGFGPWMVTKLS